MTALSEIFVPLHRIIPFKALTICTVSDHIRTHEQTTAEERQLTFNDMIEIALDSVLIGDAL